MSTLSQSSTSHRYLNILVTIVIAWIAYYAIRYATNQNMQMHTRREMQKIENQITTIYEDEIPNIHAKIDPLLIRYYLQEQLVANGSALGPRPAARREIIQRNKPPTNTP
jgi:hypothetical protein